jgi:large subunit ribosomal protein L24e
MTNLCCVCNSIVYPGHGSLFVKNNMKSFWFCRSKCKKLYNQKKNPQYINWTYFSKKKRGVVLNNTNFSGLKINKQLEMLKEYDKYLISHILYQLNRQKKIKLNRLLDFKFLKTKN